MSFFTFRNKNKFDDIASILTSQEASSKAALHQKHPHTKEIFENHNIDLRTVRHKGAKTAATAAVLGAFLALPHLVGAPTQQQLKPDFPTQTLAAEKHTEAVAAPKINHPTHNLVTSHVSPTNTESQSNQDYFKPTHKPSGDENEDTAHHSQGHIHGRSFLAPPREHELHDLGLHKGEDNDQGKAQSPGAHPSDLGANHEEKNL